MCVCWDTDQRLTRSNQASLTELTTISDVCPYSCPFLISTKSADLDDFDDLTL